MDEKLHLNKKDTSQRMSPHPPQKSQKLKQELYILFNCTRLKSIKRLEHSSFSDILPRIVFRFGNSGESLSFQDDLEPDPAILPANSDVSTTSYAQGTLRNGTHKVGKMLGMGGEKRRENCTSS
ncbi:hypothetical protein E2320_000764 [Naja naja]|nr:hypothetical protein E2320_000764 [Naja naja]